MQLTSRLVNTSENSSRLFSAHCRNATAEATIRAAGSSSGWASRTRAISAAALASMSTATIRTSSSWLAT